MLHKFQFQVDLTDAAMKSFFNLAHSAGTTANNLLQTFIEDLIKQDPTACEYFNCCTQPVSDVSFSMWAIRTGADAEAAELLEIIQDAVAELADNDFSSVLESVICDAGRDLATLYRSYCEDPIHQGRQVQSYASAVEDMKMYLQELESILS